MFSPFKTKTVLHFCLTVFLFVFLAVYTSCKKNCECLGTFINVSDSLNKPVAGAEVRLWCDNVENEGCEHDHTVKTNSSGTATFFICTPGILKLYVNGTAEGYVEIEPDDVKEVYVIIN